MHTPLPTSPLPPRSRRGFTLIELLIVVAIIAILAAIAVPNFLEAQVRSKVSRAKADMRTLATALESYRVDNNRYPPNEPGYSVIPREITTPIAYLTNSAMVDPFADKLSSNDPGIGERIRYYTYHAILTGPEAAQHQASGRTPPLEAVDHPAFNNGALTRYGPWKLLSLGPDRLYSQAGTPADAYNPVPGVLLGADVPYDPTNGTTSFGNVIRTQRLVDGMMPAP